MSLGKTWWHGAIVKRLDSYGPEEPFPPRRDPKAEQEAWERTAAWEGMRGRLAGIGTALLGEQGRVKWDRRLREAILSVEETPSADCKDSKDERELMLIAVALLLILREKQDA